MTLSLASSVRVFGGVHMHACVHACARVCACVRASEMAARCLPMGSHFARAQPGHDPRRSIADGAMLPCCRHALCALRPWQGRAEQPAPVHVRLRLQGRREVCRQVLGAHQRSPVRRQAGPSAPWSTSSAGRCGTGSTGAHTGGRGVATVRRRNPNNVGSVWEQHRHQHRHCCAACKGKRVAPRRTPSRTRATRHITLAMAPRAHTTLTNRARRRAGMAEPTTRTRATHPCLQRTKASIGGFF